MTHLKPTIADAFQCEPTHIVVTSGQSNQTYFITPDSTLPQLGACTCRGFIYYSRCRHLTEAHTLLQTYHTVQARPPAKPLTEAHQAHINAMAYRLTHVTKGS